MIADSIRRGRLAAVTALAALGPIACGSAASSDDGAPRISTARSAVIDGELSTAAEDFVVFVTQPAADIVKPSVSCGGTLIAPNLVVTAKHCVNKYVQAESFCDATGEPQAGSAGGYITDRLQANEIGVYVGVDARKRYLDDVEPPVARGSRVIDDKTSTLCSHDIAFVVLDTPITNVPIARLRLGERPAVGATFAVAGWGEMEDRIKSSKLRIRRAGIPIRRVGLPEPPLNATGSLAPKTFEAGPAACSGDSGGPGFDPASTAALGVVARALNLQPTDPSSPCKPDEVSNVYIVIADYPKELREAFVAAKAEPWLEGRATPGYLRFGEACKGDLECEGGRCISNDQAAGGASSAKSCNLDCAAAGATCPDGFVCGAAGTCVPGSPVDPSGGPDSGAPVPEPELESDPPVQPSGCALAPHRASRPMEFPSVVFAACAAISIGLISRRRSSFR